MKINQFEIVQSVLKSSDVKPFNKEHKFNMIILSWLYILHRSKKCWESIIVKYTMLHHNVLQEVLYTCMAPFRKT